ncbi:MAG: hypothetical protein AB7V22_00635 [Kiritimatiellia bacterium]
MAALLWTRDKSGKIQGFLPTEMAEALRSGTLSAQKPIRLRVPRGFRRSTEVPEGIEIDIGTEKSHKTSKYDGLIVQMEAPQAAETPRRSPGVHLDAPDYYDWLDYQAVLCEKTS